MTPNNRHPAPSKTEATHLRMPARRDKALCVIVAAIAMLLVVAGCSGSSSDSRQLAEYISGTAYYGEVYSSDADAPKRVAMESVFSLPYSGIDSRISKVIEGKDRFVLELRDSSGRTLRRVDFYAEKYTSHGDPVEPNPNESYDSITYAEFKVIVEDPPNYATLAILHDGNEIAVVERSSNAPSVSISGPAEGQVFYDGDSIPLGLKVADADGDVLDYRVYFSTDGGASYKALLKKYALRIPAVSLDSSTQARLAVSVSDGARASFVETEIFTVAENVPVETTVPVYLPPRAYDDTSNGYVSEPLRIYVLSNDIYSEGDFDLNSLTIAVSPSLGLAYVNDARNPYDSERTRTFRPFIIYIPSSVGTDTLTYSICDSNDQCDSAQVTITSIVNQPPIANDDVVGGDIGEVLRIDVLANDIDAERDFDYESLSIDVPPIFGTASVKSERIPVGLTNHTSGDTQSTSSLALRPFILKHSDIGGRQDVSTPPTIPSIFKYFIEYRYAYTAIDSLTYSICDTFDQCDTAEVTIKAGTADCTIMGTEQDDTLEGTPDDDVICGLGGDDTIYAGGGNDIIKAGLGDDTVSSGPGDDIVRGGDGNDDITGDDGADELYGSLGNDTLDGGDGDDIIHGGKGDDIIYGGPGDDTIRGNLGADTIYPGEGNDTLEGPTEPDTIIQ